MISKKQIHLLKSEKEYREFHTDTVLHGALLKTQTNTRGKNNVNILKYYRVQIREIFHRGVSLSGSGNSRRMLQKYKY